LLPNDFWWVDFEINKLTPHNQPMNILLAEKMFSGVCSSIPSHLHPLAGSATATILTDTYSQSTILLHFLLSNTSSFDHNDHSCYKFCFLVDNCKVVL